MPSTRRENIDEIYTTARDSIISACKAGVSGEVTMNESMSQRDLQKQLLSNTIALQESMRYSTSTTVGENASVGKYSSFGTFLRKYAALVQRAASLLPDVSMLDSWDLTKVKRSGAYTWPQQKEMFDAAYANVTLLKSLLEGAIGYGEDETNSLKNFLAANLRKVLFAMPAKELDVQDGIESLFVGRSMMKGTDYDRETGRVKASGKESVPDFILPNLNLCLEVKLAKTATKVREIVDEINADIMAYGTRYERQLYVVYDLGMIRDETEFKHDLEAIPGVSVLVIKH